MLRDDQDFRLAFSMISGVNASTGRILLSKLSDERRFFTEPAHTLKALTAMNDRLLADDYRNNLMLRAERERAFTDISHIRRLYFTDTDAYPRRLAECNDAPAMLYSLGSCSLDSPHMVAIVGTRHATEYGAEAARRIVERLAESVEGVVIVSGLAYGIDVAAHRAALQCNIPTVAVVAHPLNTIYPADHRDVASRIVAQGGAIVSEYSTGEAVHRGNFLARNRIIAGLCDLTIVVESDLRGGAISTANCARAYDREVMAVPGRIGDKYSRGCNLLIQNCTASMLADPAAVPAMMGWPVRPKEGEQQSLKLELPPDQEMLLKLISDNPNLTVNDIVARTGMPYSHLADLLFQLEMAGLVSALPGSRYAALNF